jgi:hypothetical protein
MPTLPARDPTNRPSREAAVRPAVTLSMPDGGAHPRVIHAHHHHRIATITQARQVKRQRFGREDVDALDRGRRALLGQPRQQRMHLGVDHVDEGVGARRQHEHQARAALARLARGGGVGPIPEPFDHGLHPRHRVRPHAGAAVQHAVHGGEADACGKGHVVQAGSFGVGHAGNHRDRGAHLMLQARCHRPRAARALDQAPRRHAQENGVRSDNQAL